MKNYTKTLVLILMIGITNLGYTQEIYKIQNTNEIDMKLTGTSTLHDWEMDTKTSTGEAQFVFTTASENVLSSLKSLSFEIVVKDLKSDSKGLDNNAYEALKADKFKNISYELTSSTLSPESIGYLIKTKGKLSIAGVTKDILMDVHLILNSNNTITCKGSYKLKMTDYNVEPPSFMMGLMKTGNEADLEFEVIYCK